MLAFKSLSWALLLQACFANQLLDPFHNARQMKNDFKKPIASRSPASGDSACASPPCYRYYNSKTAPYFIESWPEVDFPTGEFYGGSVPIDESDPSRTLFFIFKPAEITPVDEVTIWLSGGPGCSSLEALLQENGPISWQPGTLKPIRNEWAWSKLTNMLWVDQPVGTGFSQGNVTATTIPEIAKDFVGFFRNWQKLFGIKKYKIYLAGESYAGKYIPYFGVEMLELNDTTYFDLQGALIYDPCIGDCGWIQLVYPTYYFALHNNAILNLDKSTLAALDQKSEKCGFTEYLDKYLQFPPPGAQPPSPNGPNQRNPCYVSNELNKAAAKNPCFDIYHITDTCPMPWDVLEDRHQYFQRHDVKKAIHAPRNVTWYECANKVFRTPSGWDVSPYTNLKVLPQLIEATNRVLVSNADWDALVFTNGTLLVIQNTTWNGAQGFQSAPSLNFFVPLSYSPLLYLPQGVMGIQHYERGLQWVESYQSGHRQAQYQPRSTYVHLEWVLRRIDKLPSSLNSSVSSE